jgi:hypothetical protein
MDFEIKTGTRIKFVAPGHYTVQEDTVRKVFWQQTTSQSGVALVLTGHSWVWASDIVGVIPASSEASSH